MAYVYWRVRFAYPPYGNGGLRLLAGAASLTRPTVTVASFTGGCDFAYPPYGNGGFVYWRVRLRLP
ncbi:hypothetical protein ACRXLK_004256, partial [Cronobacter turicensis]